MKLNHLCLHLCTYIYEPDNQISYLTRFLQRKTKTYPGLACHLGSLHTISSGYIVLAKMDKSWTVDSVQHALPRLHFFALKSNVL